MAANQLATGSSLEAILKNYVRVYEEQLIIDSAAKIYAKVADKGGVRLNDLDGILDAPSQTVAVLFHKHDKDNSGVIDAKELLGIVRQLNFMRGYCGGCYKPVGSNDGTFLCVPCETFALCADCYPDRGQLHPEHSDFKSAIDVEATEASDLPPGVGDLLKAEVDDLFTDVDGNGDGEISTEEFEIYCSTDGWSPEFTKFVLSCDFDGDGRISHREALYLLTGLAMVRACDECNELSFVSDGKLMSCVECTSWYDVCVICWNAGRRSHLHDRFKVVKPFQLRTVGLYYKHSHDDVWAVAVGNANLWEKYKPFVGDKVTKTAKLGVPASAQPPKTQSSPPVAKPVAKAQSSPSVVESAGSAFVDGFKQGVEQAAQDQIKEAIIGDTDWGEVVSSVFEAAGEVMSWFFNQ